MPRTGYVTLESLEVQLTAIERKVDRLLEAMTGLVDILREASQQAREPKEIDGLQEEMSLWPGEKANG